ncbi:MAG: ferrous iron transport protein A [Pirellulaceae bacterium]|nr:ferrous iron transport protein A [Planctomycetales bacterium]
MTTLDRVPIGDSVRIERIDGMDEVSVRLLEMGMTPTTSVTMVGSAPFGDPLEVELRGYRLSLRRSEAQRVIVSSH